MAELFHLIRSAVRGGRYIFSDHADNMLRDRSIKHWHIIHGLDDGKLLGERPRSRPNPSVEVEQILPDGTPIKVVWSYVRTLDMAKLGTVHFFDR